MPIIGGNNYFDVVVPSFSTIPYSVYGHSLSAGLGQSGTLGIRKDGHLSITPIVRNDAAGKDQTDGYMAKLEVDSWQNDYASFKSVYLLTKQFVNIAPTVQSGDVFNFFENSANPPFAGASGSPNGSRSMACEFAFDSTPKDVTNKLTFSTKLHPLELDWMLANATAAYGGTGAATGVNTVSLSSMSYSQAAYGIPGINSITLSGDAIGLFADDVKVSIKTKSPQKDLFERPLPKLIEVEIDFKALQGRYYDAQAFASHRNQDFTAVIQLWTGMNLTFVNSLSIVGAPDFSDTNATIPCKMKGRIAYDGNVLASVGPNITFNDSTSTVTFTRSVYNP